MELCNYILTKWDCIAAAETWAVFQINKNILKLVFCKRRLDKAIKSKGCQRDSPFSPCSPSCSLCLSHPGSALTTLHRESDFMFSWLTSPSQRSLSTAGEGWGVQGLESPHLAAAHRAELLAGKLQPEQLETDPTKRSFCICKVDLKGQPCLLSCLSRSHEQQYHYVQSELKLLIFV